MDDAEFVREGMERTGFQGTATEFAAIWCEIFTQNEAMQATLNALRARPPMYLLSNTSELHKQYFLRAFPIFQHFQDGVYSHWPAARSPARRYSARRSSGSISTLTAPFTSTICCQTSRPLRGWGFGHFTTALPGIRRCRRSLTNGWGLRALVDGRKYLS
jgi:hypothetical protein